ncbi:hypothetical protein [Endozoicomonas atrinae]|uniref:hypothetical protein n=1 Tax=Endozoicomonas atrinae TaxID=1333660 RepID=UPI003B00481F
MTKNNDVVFMVKAEQYMLFIKLNQFKVFNRRDFYKAVQVFEISLRLINRQITGFTQFVVDIGKPAIQLIVLVQVFQCTAQAG